MLGPLIPEQVFGPVVARIEPPQWKHARSISGTGTADRVVCKCTFNLMEHRRLKHYSAIGLGHCHTCNGEFDQGAHKAGSDEVQRRQLRQPSGDGPLPEQIVRCFEGRPDTAVLTLVQSAPVLHGPVDP